MDYLRRFYDIMGECGLPCPPYEAWHAVASGDNAELWPIRKGGEMVGGILFHGQTVHIAITPEWQGRWIAPSFLRALKTWKHPGEVWADMRPDNHQVIELAKRVGFRFQADQGMYHRYVKEPPT